MMIIVFGVFILLIVANALLTYIKGTCISKLGAEAGKDLKIKIAYELLHAQYGKIIKLEAGNTIQTLNSDTAAVCSFIGGELINLVSQFMMALGGLAFLIYVNPILALVTFSYTPIGMYFTLTLNKKMNKLYPARSDNEGRALSVTEQVLSAIPVIKSFIAEKLIREKVKKEYSKVYHTDMDISLWNALIQTACSSTAMVPRMTYLIYGGYMVTSGKLSIGMLIAVYDLISFIIGPTVYFPFLLNSLNRSIAAINRISKLTEVAQAETKVVRDYYGTPKIKIENLTFAYEGGRPVINQFSFEHEGSGIIALCGKSGSGKTTLLDIISGLYKPEKGKVEIEGRVTVVSQNTYLFEGDIYENVRVVKPSAGDEEVKRALTLAGADNFAESCRDFNNLSGGQKSRISLARAILQDSPIWLLDEPTSALDEETEKLVLDTIKELSKNKLILISAHRASLINITERRINL
jgi:ABC-type multidrug transport system fused ATPase/permease subunit